MKKASKSNKQKQKLAIKIPHAYVMYCYNILNNCK